MKLFVRIIQVCLFLMCINASGAFAQFSVVGEIRPRFEYRNGFKKPIAEGQDPAAFVEQRSRLYFNYLGEKFKFKLSLQDVRIWGNAAQIYKTDPSLNNVYEAWGSYAISGKSSIMAGRMELDYDNARFLGNLGWAAQGRSHDAIKYVYKNDTTGIEFHVGAAFNQNVPFEPGKLTSTFYSDVNNYKTMQYAWFHKEISGGGLSFMIFNDGRQALNTTSDSTDVFFRQTYAFYGKKKLGSVGLEGELYYQGGKNAAGNDVSAALIALNATFKTKITPLTIGFDYLTGTAAGDSKDKSFAPLYGTNHKFYGFMDYFYVGNPHMNKGLVNPYLKTNFKLGGKSNLIAHIHYFQSAVGITNTETGEDLSKTLGQEIDLVYNLNLGKEVNLKVGYSQMFASESMEYVKSVANAKGSNNWAWVMLTIKPTLFTSK
ncbi:alginate export family protein [Flexithrix dorotheae]|uniref:alginate export family protein n=1 Tax=Flexithrix dorotheae TaxID=70993 RepID=UPI0012FA29E6|nr:alginate export family protein [Flexithrix dorotheae]